jgi:hypothetical protein
MYLRLSPYQEILQGVITSLQVNEGIIKITGKSGSGKTALCSQLFHELEANSQPAVFFLKPPASAVALQNDILDNLKLDPTGNFTRTLTAYLLANTAPQKPLVLIFDDAQQLDAQTFSAIRMLCNIQDGARDGSRNPVRHRGAGREARQARAEGRYAVPQPEFHGAVPHAGPGHRFLPGLLDADGRRDEAHERGRAKKNCSRKRRGIRESCRRGSTRARPALKEATTGSAAKTLLRQSSRAPIATRRAKAGSLRS